MLTVRFLILAIFLSNVAVAATIRHVLRPHQYQVGMLSRNLANVVESSAFSLTPSRYMLQVQRPKDEGSFSYFTGLCKPMVKEVEQNGKIIQKLMYKRGAEFTRADVDSAYKPNIPDLTEIKTPEDIIKVATFYRKYANYMTVDFLKTQEVLGEYVNEHRLALLSEPANLLHLIRPGEPSHIIDRVANRSKKALEQPRDAENQLILLFYKNGLNFAFGCFDDVDWENWYPAHKDHIDAILRFAKAIYKDTPDIEAYKTAEEFNAALMEIDPDFKQLVTGK